MTRTRVSGQVFAQQTLDRFLMGEPRAPPAQRPRLETKLDALSFPPRVESTETRGRPAGTTKYVVRVMPAAVTQRVLELIRQVNEDADTIRRLVDHFKQFTDMNRIERLDLALFCFITDINVQGLKPSTCRSYTKLILEGKARAGEKIEGPLTADLLKVLGLMEAEGDVHHAVDVERSVLIAMLGKLSRGRFRLTFFVLLFFGCRAADAERLTGSSFWLENDGHIRLHFRVTKNHRRRQDAYTIRVKPPPECLIPELVEIIGKPEMAGSALPVLQCDAFNRELKAMAGAVEGMTSYTLRRSFIHDIIKQHTSGSTTEWLAVAKMTGHYQLEVLRTSYAPQFADTL